jgi:sulfate transport system ATP-binding protein
VENTLLELRGVTKRFGEATALAETSLSIDEGSFVAIVGPSGCGKSTLFNVIAGLLAPDGGEVRLEGKPVTGATGHVGYMLQKDLLVPWRTVEDNITMAARLTRRVTNADRAEARRVATEYGLGDFLRHYPRALSGGMRQRVAFMRTLVTHQPLLLLDEPFGALDAQVRQQLRAWLRDLHTTIAVTTLLVTHDQEEAMEVADRLAIINDGRLEQVGAPTDMYDNPANEFVMKFLGPATQFDGRWVRPHDLVVHPDRAFGGQPAVVERVTHLGFEIRADLRLTTGQECWVQLSRGSAAESHLVKGEAVWVSLVGAGDELSVTSPV